MTVFRYFRHGVLACVLFALPVSANSADGVAIFDVRKSLPLEPDEPTYHDYYVNSGPESGLRKGMYVTVVRQIPVHDPLQNKAQAMLNIPVAKVQIIHVERNISVARRVDEFANDERPTLEYEGIMVGDRLDLESVSMDAPSKKSKKDKKGFFGQRNEQKEERDAERTTAAVPETPPAAPPAESVPTKIVPEGPTVPAPTQPEKATPPAVAPDMVRVPIPPEGKS